MKERLRLSNLRFTPWVLAMLASAVGCTRLESGADAFAVTSSGGSGSGGAAANTVAGAQATGGSAGADAAGRAGSAGANRDDGGANDGGADAGCADSDGFNGLGCYRCAPRDIVTLENACSAATC